MYQGADFEICYHLFNYPSMTQNFYSDPTQLMSIIFPVHFSFLFLSPWYLKKYSSIIILYNIHFNAPKRTYLIYKLAHLNVPNRLFLLLFYMIKTLRYVLKSCLLAFKYPVGFVSVTLATAKFGMLTEQTKARCIHSVQKCKLSKSFLFSFNPHPTLSGPSL